MQHAQEFYNDQLFDVKNKFAFDYISIARGLSKKMLVKYGIGYAPSQGHLLHDYLSKLGFTTKNMIDSGLLVQPSEENKKPYDRFRDRIMFPVKNIQGKIITFGGRALSKNVKA